MSEYAPDDSRPTRQESDANLQISLDDSANNSIIGKVKSRVSSILPNRLSQWFSPSAKLQNDSLNGSMCSANTSLPTCRRRRYEFEEEDNYENEEEDVQRCAQYEESNHMYPKQLQNRDRNIDDAAEDDDDADDDDDDESQNSEEEYNGSSVKQARRDLKVEHQPPAKRSRLNIEVRDSPIGSRRQPLLSSTPAVGRTHLRNAPAITSAPRSTYQKYGHLNLYGSQSKKEPPFNFAQQKDSKSIKKSNADIIDLITNSTYDESLTELSNVYGSSRGMMGSRKNLNIPSTSGSTGPDREYSTVAHLKRQPLSSAKPDLSSTNTMGVSARRTSTTVHEIENERLDINEHKIYDGTEKEDEMLTGPNANSYNGNIEGPSSFGSNKRQKLINGISLDATITQESSGGVLIDSASESGESGTDVVKINTSNMEQRKTGLFNMTPGGISNTRNSSRTSSFGNGLNFYSHLEGRKSLFSGSQHGNSNPLNNSTLSLTSLNRRQFNASIYGSTSALSDSRLLNTFSPFYKGKTTYGGAAAYNKYTAAAGASAVRITPTLIRPTSSLSTLSSSNNSLANTVNSYVGESSTISSTAKRILDLINDFATPLSEAKKMASNLKTNPNLHIPPHAKGRLNESDLNVSRAVRLSHVRTPYSRSDVILHPSGNARDRSTMGSSLPPVKELQVPTMSQLLQMKKMQNVTENARKITKNSTENSLISEYTLPDTTNSKSIPLDVTEKEQQKHTNKIRHKISYSLRTSAIKDLKDEEPPPAVNLPNIAFPLMESVPKIDIQINTPLSPVKSNSESKSLKLLSSSEVSCAEKIDSFKSPSFAFNCSPIDSFALTSSSNKENKKVDLPKTQPISTLQSVNSFKFSEPIQVVDVLPPDQSITNNELDKFKFSAPLEVIVPPKSNCFETTNSQPQQPQLKEGSCLDALSKPFALPPISSEAKAIKETLPSKASSNISSSFGNQFKKLANEWECEACMIRNKSDVNKCVACETSRKNDPPALPQAMSLPASTPISSFGQQFKKSSNEWECNSCMVRNKEEITKCVACETPRKSEVPQNTTTLPAIQNSFGDAFKPKLGNWECQTCMISNKNENNECVACQSKKPGYTNITSSVPSQSTVPANQFKFGFAGGLQLLTNEQNVSKWNCDACITRNDANRTKCACCDNPRPLQTSAKSSNSEKFQFGATAASKFKFGFGTGENIHKEEDIRKELSKKSEELKKDSSMEFGLSTSQTTPLSEGFQFGNKSATTSNNGCKKDETDSNTHNNKGFKFGSSSIVEKPSVSEALPSVPTATGFVFGLKSSSVMPTTATATTTTTSTTSSSSPVVATSTNTKDSNNDKPKDLPPLAFGFGTNIASTKSGGFSFGNKLKTDESTEEQKTSGDTTFKAPGKITGTSNTSGFIFGSSAANNNSAAVSATLVSSSFTTTSCTAAPTTATTSTTTAAVVKPSFTFGTNPLSTPTVNSQAGPAFSTFSFGKPVAATTTEKPIFAAVTSTSTITTTASATTKTSSLSTLSTTTTAPASTNIFGSFGRGSSSSNPSTSPIFGSSVNSPANNNISTVSSSTSTPILSNTTSQFVGFGSQTTSNVFGSFGGVSGIETKSSALVKPNGPTSSASVFGNVGPSSTAQSSQLNSSNFVFGSNAADKKVVTTTASTVGSVTSTSTTWPKNSFVFGSNAAATSSTVNVSENKDVAKPVMFGTFGLSGSKSNSQQQTSSIFGAQPSNNAAVLSASATTTTIPTNSGTNLFATKSTSAATSIFSMGNAANSSGNAATPTPAFGSSPFGGAASSTSATPTFGSTAATGPTFGNFGGSSSNTTTNPAEVKKPEAAFNFGSAPATQSTSGGFNFGSAVSTPKPAFNFGSTSTAQQPTFNFTGTTESQSSTKPFQFGATPPAPVFNFNRGVIEGTPNAPFQFNAGAAPVSSNIFAPAPIPGAQAAQQAKRKIRAPIRRGTQR